MAPHFVTFLRSLSLPVRPLCFMIIKKIVLDFPIAIPLLIVLGHSLLLQINSKLQLMEGNSIFLEVNNDYFKLVHFQKVNLYYLRLVVVHYFYKDFV